LKTAGVPGRRDLAVTGLVVLLFLTLTYVTGYAVFALLGLLAGRQLGFGLPIEVRLLGVALLVAGMGVAAYVFRFRHPRDVWVSTSATLMKLMRRRPLDQRVGRTEPFIPRGPYAYVRSPMYFGVVTIVFGLAVAVESIPLLIWGLILACFYWFFLIPFEESELQALFGESYLNYRGQVPKLFPNGRRFRGPEEASR